jgi:hypothetical protein
MARLFFLGEAEALLPEVDRILREAMGWKPRLAEADSALQGYLRRASLVGGCRMDTQKLAELRLARELAAGNLKEAIDRMERLGCEVKDLDVGLVDFPTRYEGRTVCLCWKLGEPSIRFWHDSEAGFAGRRAIDRKFLDGHRGGRQATP